MFDMVRTCWHAYFSSKLVLFAWLHSFDHDGADENDDAPITNPCSTWFAHVCTHNFRQSTYFFVWLHSFDHDRADENDDSLIANSCSPLFEHSCTHTFLQS